jgi:hypothetical protein
MNDASGIGLSLGSICLLLFGAVFYFLPSIVAFARRHHNGLAIFILNLFLGWSVLGWIIALVWSCTAVMRSSGE